MIVIHVGNEEQARQVVLFTEFPCLLGSDFDASLAVYNDDCCICYTDSFFYFSHKIKIAGSI